MRPRARRAGRRAVEQHGRLHLDAEDAALRPALVLAGVGVVEDVARDERADAVLLADLLRRVHRGVDDLPARRGSMRLVVDVRRDRLVGRDGADRDDQVAELEVRLQTAAGAGRE